MRYKVEIHSYERKIANTLKRIEDSNIDEKDKRLLSEFHYECTIKGLSKARMLKYFDVLGRIAIWLSKPLQQVKKEDIMNLIQRVESSDYSEWTKHDYKVVLKIFYKWLRRTEDYPEEVKWGNYDWQVSVKWIKASFRSRSMLPEEILTEDDIKKLVECATSLRDKAFILVLYESGVE